MAAPKRIVAVVGVLVVGIGLAVWWLAPPRPEAPGTVAPLGETNTPAGPQPAAPNRFFARPTARPSPPVTEPPAPAEPSMTPPAEEPPADSWEERLDEILRATGDHAEACQKLLALLPGLPASAQVEVVQHLLNLTEDENYASVAGLLTHTNTAPEVLELLMTDLLGRPNSVQLPLLLEVARQPGHPQAAGAREMLEFHLAADYGEDWTRWEAALRRHLKENPD